MNRLLSVFCSVLFAIALWVSPAPANAYENPDLLPDHPTNIIDLARALTPVQEERLGAEITQFEEETGWKLRVLTQFDRTPGRAVKQFWGLDNKSIMLVADARGGNILNFSVGEDLYPLLPRTFWIELQTRFGNQFFVTENGEDEAIIQTIQTLETCLRQGGCNVVPGLPQEQWVLTLVTSIVGGLVAGFTGQPRKEGQFFAWQWTLIFSPLWGILFLAFGVGPVVTRTSDWVPLARNVAGFVGGFLAAFLLPSLLRPTENPEG